MESHIGIIASHERASGKIHKKSNIGTFAFMIVSSGEEEDIIPPNPIDQFIQLLKDNKIAPSLKWDQVVKQL